MVPTSSETGQKHTMDADFFIMKKIIVNSKTHGRQEILLDDTDLELISKYKWHVSKLGKRLYAVTTIRIFPGRNGQRSLKMHTLITGNKIKIIDHIDLNGLNNQKKNLRDGSGSINNLNREMNYNPNGYKGVTFLKKCRLNPYQSRIVVNYKIIYLGAFPTALDAALAYDNAAKKYWGDLARTNFKKK